MATASTGKRTRRTARSAKKALFIQKPTCTTCRKAKKFMERRGFQLYFRDLAKERLSATELEKLIGKRDYTDFLNPRNEVYRKENMKEEPPSRKQAIRLMAKVPNLIRRPVIVAGGRVVVGFDEDGIARL
ncbi:MAG TPA: ArsC/Spx/MgsR family protein [Candidatus Baltobacteraceae bacterium]|nr:ArsC/Spx/MgsR family protein [Candidatus Baltobacteraceae bacterium]